MANVFFCMTRFAAALTLVCCLLQVASQAQQTDATAQPAAADTGSDTQDDELRFRSLELYEQRDALGRILKQMAEERDSRRREANKLVALASMAKEVPEKTSGDDQIRLCIQLQQGIAELKSSLRESYLRCLGIIDSTQKQARSDDLTADGAKLLREAERELRAMMTQQQKEDRKLGALERHTRKLIAAIPPPETFTSRVGLDMKRVGKGPAAFYISAAPIPVDLYRRFLEAEAHPATLNAWTRYLPDDTPSSPATAVTWQGASAFAGWLSREEGVAFTLLSPGQCSMLNSDGMTLSVATWLDQPWKHDDYVLRRELKRFGVGFAAVWDQQGQLGAGKAVFGDLPFARYNDLGFYLTTEARTGLQQRWQRLKAALE